MLDRNLILEEIKNASNLAELDKTYREYLGKNGKISLTLKNLQNLPPVERAKAGREANELKNFIAKEVKRRSGELKIESRKKEFEKEKIDITAPGKKIPAGHLHPLTKVFREAGEIFGSMGFEIVEGPEVETEWYNFDALNIPPEHPARDLWDTFWLKNPKSEARNPKQIQNSKFKIQNLLLRTHTSPVQIRFMETHQPPFRIIAPGRCFRHEATDASHDIQFHQIEGLMIGKDISLANLKGVAGGFMKRFFGENVKLRWQPSFFPFVEPGLELHIKRETGNKWIEIAGAGMVHPNVFKAVRYNPKEWQGFAFGMGLDRLAMLKYKIDDIRLFYSGDLRFLKQF